MKTAVALLLLSSASPTLATDRVEPQLDTMSDPGGTFAWHSSFCNRYVAPVESQFAGDTIEFAADGRLIYNGEATKPVFEKPYGDGFMYSDAETHWPILAVGWRDQFSAVIQFFYDTSADMRHEITLWEAACQ
jgi:hypothetical protein